MVESMQELEARQEQEEAELEEKATAHLEAVKASAGKGKKAKEKIEAAEREIEQWRYDMSERHREEREEVGGGESGAAGAADEGKQPAAEAEEPPAKTAEELEEDRALRKKEKAQKKKQNRANKDREHEDELERERAAAGPSKRAVELAAIAGQLARRSPPLHVLEVLGDGHCLYRAVADQIRRFRPGLHSWAKAPDAAHEEIRAVCAKALRRRQDDYAPFAELSDGEDFAGYCERVEHSADWGGELELRALADELGVQIHIYKADCSEPLALGPDDARGEPLRVTYHQHWYALGEHYNSAVLRDGDGES